MPHIYLNEPGTPRAESDKAVGRFSDFVRVISFFRGEGVCYNPKMSYNPNQGKGNFFRKCARSRFISGLHLDRNVTTPFCL